MAQECLGHVKQPIAKGYNRLIRLDMSNNMNVVRRQKKKIRD